MLNIWFGKREGFNPYTDTYFDHTYRDEWFDDPFVKEMVLDVDKSTVISSHMIESPVFGPIPPVTLSGGVKTLILVYEMPEMLFGVSSCGDNCSKWFLKMAEKADRTVVLEHVMDFGHIPFGIKLLDTGEIVHSMKELIMLDAVDFLKRE